MKKIIISIIVFFISLMSFSQGEANIWYFGENAGLDFNNCSPISIDGGKINTREGCSSFSDASGNLLFYSDGSTVWNRNHVVMVGGFGLAGDSSSSQSAMIIPKPSTSQYIIFTVGSQSSDNAGFNYYTIDMDASGGLGAVIDGPIDLTEGRSSVWSEKVAAIKGPDGTFWAVSFVENEFYAYKVSTSGVQISPIKSEIDYTATDPRGYLKISPNGKKLAIAHMADATFILYDFDVTTGIASNERILSLTGGANKPYGVEFSADSNKLYVHASNDSTGDAVINHSSTLYQFDVTSSNHSTILNSRTIIDSRNLYRGALQLGPDKKIYRALSESYNIGLPSLGVIENPEVGGTGCNYQHNGISLGSNNSTQGLPPFIASIFTKIQISGSINNEDATVMNDQTFDVCEGDTFEINPEPVDGVDITYTWNLNRQFFSNATSLSFTNMTDALSGNYALIVEYTDLCGNLIILRGKFTLLVHSLPVGPTEITLYNCDVDENLDGFTDFNLELSEPFLLLETNSSTILNDTVSLITYHNTYDDAVAGINEFDGSMPYNNSTSSAVYAHVNSLFGCGFYVSEINLVVSTIDLASDYKYEIITCDDDGTNNGLHIIDLSEATNDIISQFPLEDNLSVSYFENLLDAQLNQNQISPQNLYFNQVPYLQHIYVRVDDTDENKCTAIGQYVDLIVNPIPEFETEPELLLCSFISPTITLETFNQADEYTYNWLNANGELVGNESSISVSSGGLYSVIGTTNQGCETTQTVNVIQFEIPEIDQDDILIIDDSENNTISLNIENSDLGNGEYQFSLDNEFGPFQNEPYFEHVLPGKHILYINADNGCGSREFEVYVLGFPNFFTPNNDGYNDWWNVLGFNNNLYEFSQIKIFDRFGKIIAEIEPNSNGWDGFYNGKELPETDYWFSIKLININGEVRNRKGHFSLIRR